MKSLFLSLGLLLSANLSTAQDLVVTGFVVSVYDGDTATVVSCHNQVYKVRFAKIDTPELKQDFGKESKACLSDKILNKLVRVHVSAIDLYQRSVGEVFLDGKSVNEQLVEEGCAWVYDEYNKDEDLKLLEERARLSRKGLWATIDPMPPWDWRKLQKSK